ncbi:hypothetical protein P3X46_010457 [Hevea brasiliensis]|uniref:NAC domain-containing protein n=1 Tax=Hevea brasiliensis TaxID=3981 RepID=A0ABQ9MHP1_HEVBR|nr:NAC domain-containing protein 72 [Hevea brasiliensis]KAJ9178581.1 hypothetical protein P3X46_010457 [Hevea brasiliensis]
MVPHGFRFNPTDQELIQILDRKASEQEMPLPFIVYANLYEHEPQDLEWNHSAALGNEERYYYCKRENDSREVTGRGWWKATSHVKKVHVNENLVGYKRPLTFHRYRDQERNRNNAIKTNWIMHEYSLESKATEWRLCKIKYKGKPSMQEEMENIRQRYSSRNDSDAAGGSMNTQTGSDREQENPPPAVSSTMPLENGNHQTYYWNMQQLPQAPYGHPYQTNGYYFNEQQEQLELSEQQFSSLWSWQN